MPPTPPDKQRHELTTEERRRGAYGAAGAKRKKKREADAYAKDLRAQRKVYKRENWYPDWNATTRAAEREAREPQPRAVTQLPAMQPRPRSRDFSPEEREVAAYERTLPELRCAHGVYVFDCPHCTPDPEDIEPARQPGRYVW